MANLPPPLALDVRRDPWPVTRVAGAFSANTAHILSWSSVECMFAGLARVVGPGGLFCLYGPFNEGGEYTSAGNAQLDVWLRARNERDARDNGSRSITPVGCLLSENGFGSYPRCRVPVVIPAGGAGACRWFRGRGKYVSALSRSGNPSPVPPPHRSSH